MKKFAALALSSTLSCAPFGAHAQGYPQLKGPGGTLVAPAPVFASNPLCPNGGVNGVPALGVAGPGIVGQSYFGVVCPSPGGSASASVQGIDSVSGQSCTLGTTPTCLLPSVDKNSGASLTAAQTTAAAVQAQGPWTAFSNQTLAPNQTYVSQTFTAAKAFNGELICKIPIPNGATVVVETIDLDGGWVTAQSAAGGNLGCSATAITPGLPITAGMQLHVKATGGPNNPTVNLNVAIGETR